MRSLFAVVLLALVAAAAAGSGVPMGKGHKAKQFMKYAITNLWTKCIGQQAMDKYALLEIKAAAKCYNREFDSTIQPVYIKPYPVDGQFISNRLTSNQGLYHSHQQRQNLLNRQPFQQFQQYQQFPQQQQYQQYQQQPLQQQQFQNQQQQYRQPQYGYQQPQQFYGPQFQQYQQQPFPNQFNQNQQTLNRQSRAANKVKNVQNQVIAETNVAGEAELYYYNKLKEQMTHKVGNFSCIMHEMGYFTQDNQVDFAKYRKTYQDLTLPDPMKEEFLQNIDTCQEVSECLPEKCFAKYPFGVEYGRQFFFVQCEKKKAMEVCLKKQMIDDYYKYKDLLKDEGIQNIMEDDSDFDVFSLGM